MRLSTCIPGVLPINLLDPQSSSNIDIMAVMTIFHHSLHHVLKNTDYNTYKKIQAKGAHYDQEKNKNLFLA